MSTILIGYSMHLDASFKACALTANSNVLLLLVNLFREHLIERLERIGMQNDSFLESMTRMQQPLTTEPASKNDLQQQEEM